MEHEKHHIVGYLTNLWVWVVLIAFTLITVGAQFANFEKIAIIVALIIASLKALTVLLYYMHLKFDTIVFRIMFLLVIAVFVSFILLSFVDYFFR